MVGMSATTYRLQNKVLKMPRIDEEADITQENARAMQNEASVYLIVGRHCRIANCLYISPGKDLIVLEYYPHGNLKKYIAESPTIKIEELVKWALQMIEGVEAIHKKNIRHSDLRLDQWLIDHDWNARLSDFNASGFDGDESKAIAGRKAVGIECPTHFMPRDPVEDNSVRSDLFALGSSLYELEVGKAPFVEKDDETITECYKAGLFPYVKDLRLGAVVSGCWRGEYTSATDVLGATRQI